MATNTTTSINLFIKEGRNLAAKDAGNTSDPYCKVFVSSVYPPKKVEALKTQVIKTNLNPKWNAVFSVLKGITKEDLKEKSRLPTIKVECWDQDKFTDDFMGQFELHLGKLAFSDYFEEWVDVQPRNAKDKVSGSILIGVKFHQSASNTPTANSKFSVEELKKMEAEFKKTHDKKQMSSKEDLLKYIVKLNLLDSIVNSNLQRSGINPEGELEKKIISDLYKDKEFMDIIAGNLFDILDSDKSGTIEWQELVFGLSVMIRGDKAETARLKFRVIDLDDSGSLTKEEYKQMAKKDLRSTFAGMRIGFKVGMRIGIALEASNKSEAKKLQKIYDALPFEEIFNRLEALLSSEELLTALVDLVFSYADTDKNGTISLEEFVNWATNVEQQAAFTQMVNQMLTPFLTKLTVELQEEFIASLEQYFGN